MKPICMQIREAEDSFRHGRSLLGVLKIRSLNGRKPTSVTDRCGRQRTIGWLRILVGESGRQHADADGSQDDILSS
jgi:hypothetical protein